VGAGGGANACTTVAGDYGSGGLSRLRSGVGQLRQSHAEVCSADPGRVEDLVVRTDSETLARWHLRHLTYEPAAREAQSQSATIVATISRPTSW
jgi:hypothetical protein